VEKNVQSAIRKYNDAASSVRSNCQTCFKGHALAMNAFGSLYFNEFKDFKQAAEWFRKAADKGCARAQNNLGLCYELGLGVDQDKEAAFNLFVEAAQKGHVQAMFNLGHFYLENARQTHVDDVKIVCVMCQQYKMAAYWFFQVIH